MHNLIDDNALAAINFVGKAIHTLDEALAFQAAKQLSVRDRPSTRPDGSFQITDVLAILN